MTSVGRIRHSRLARHLPLVAVSIAFVVSRAIYLGVFGIRFDETGIEWACQTLDLELLRHDLLRNVFYLHHQAPLWNLLIGVVLKLCPAHHAEAFAAVHSALGFGLAVSLLSIMRSVGVKPLVRTLTTIAFSISPPVIAYEWWINYHYLGAPLLAMSIASLGVFLRAKKEGWGHASFALFVVTILARSDFGLTWLIAIVAVLLVTRPVPRKTLARVSAIPLLFVFLYTIKTPIQTGRSFGHALLAPNLALKVLKQMPGQERKKVLAEGGLSPLAHLDPFVIPSETPGVSVHVPKTGIPSLDEERKQNGEPNANCLAHVYLGDIYMKDAKWLILHYPGEYLRSVGRALSVAFWKGSTDVDVVPETRAFQATAQLQRLTSKALLYDKTTGALWVLRIAFPLSLLHAVLWLIGPKAALPSSRTQAPMLAVMVLSILSAAATVLISWGDYSRYRFDVDALFLVLTVLFVQAAVGRTRSIVQAVLDRSAAVPRAVRSKQSEGTARRFLWRRVASTNCSVTGS